MDELKRTLSSHTSGRDEVIFIDEVTSSRSDACLDRVAHGAVDPADYSIRITTMQAHPNNDSAKPGISHTTLAQNRGICTHPRCAVDLARCAVYQDARLDNRR